MLAVLASGTAGADVKAGVDAWKRGDFRAAVEQWRPLAISGDADAEFNLAQAYKLGRGVPLDPALAESWFRKAAMQGHVQAQDNYGLALFQNDKKQEAVPWLEKSVARDEPRAELVLGTMLFNGDGVPREFPRAYALMTRASQQGLKSASETLAQMDQYISPADRERGTALAQQYAAQARSAEVASSGADLRASDGSAESEGPAARTDTRAVPAAAARVAARERNRRERDARADAPLPARDAPARQDGPPTTRPVAAPPPRELARSPQAARNASPLPARRAPAQGPARFTGKGWRVQLGAFSESGNAQALWSRLAGRFAGVSPSYVKAGRVTRLQAGPYRTRAEAQRACASAHVSCVVVAP